MSIEDEPNILVLRNLGIKVSALETANVLDEAGLHVTLRLVEKAQPHGYPVLLGQVRGRRRLPSLVDVSLFDKIY